MTSKSATAPSTSQRDEKNFPVRLHYMLTEIEKDNLDYIISWQPHGRCFVVHDQKAFVEEVLPLWFRQSKFASFQRQLNLYGFTRLTKGKDKNGYYHPLFLRGKMHLSEEIKRIKVKGNGPRKPSCPESEPNFYLLTSLLKDVEPSTPRPEGMSTGQTVSNEGSVSDSASLGVMQESAEEPSGTRATVVFGSTNSSHAPNSLIDMAAASILSVSDEPRNNPSALAMYFLKRQRQQELSASIYGRIALHLLEEASPAQHVATVFPADRGQASNDFHSTSVLPTLVDRILAPTTSPALQAASAFPANRGQAPSNFHSTSVLPTLVDRILGDLMGNTLFENRNTSQENILRLP